MGVEFDDGEGEVGEVPGRLSVHTLSSEQFMVVNQKPFSSLHSSSPPALLQMEQL